MLNKVRALFFFSAPRTACIWTTLLPPTALSPMADYNEVRDSERWDGPHDTTPAHWKNLRGFCGPWRGIRRFIVLLHSRFPRRFIARVMP